MDIKEFLKHGATPKEALRYGFLCFGLLGFLQVAGRQDLVGAEPVFGPWVSLGLALFCLVLLEFYSYLRRRWAIEDTEDRIEATTGSRPPRPGD